ncbi:MAG: hypothetical protein ACXW39_05825 [Nitrospira sp.]
MKLPEDYEHRLRVGAPPAKHDQRQLVVSKVLVARLKALQPDVNPSALVRRLLAEYVENLEERS